MVALSDQRTGIGVTGDASNALARRSARVNAPAAGCLAARQGRAMPEAGRLRCMRKAALTTTLTTRSTSSIPTDVSLAGAAWSGRRVRAAMGRRRSRRRRAGARWRRFASARTRSRPICCRGPRREAVSRIATRASHASSAPSAAARREWDDGRSPRTAGARRQRHANGSRCERLPVATLSFGLRCEGCGRHSPAQPISRDTPRLDRGA